MLDRILEQVTGMVAALIAQDPGVRRVDWDDPGRALDAARRVSFIRDFVEAADPSRPAVVCISREGERSEVNPGEVAERSASLAGALAARGVGRGDVVMTVLGDRPEWVYAMLACWRIGAVALPCAEQLRPADLRARIDRVGPRAVVADARDLDLVAAAGFDGLVLELPDAGLLRAEPAPLVEPAATDPALIVFTAGPAGEPKPIRHSHGYLSGQHVQAERWYGPPRRPCLVHGRERLVAVRTQRVRGCLAARRNGAAPRRPLRPRRAARAARARARCRALHVPHRVPRDRQTRGAPPAGSSASRPRRRGAAQPGGRARLAGGGEHLDPRRLRPDRDRPSDRHADRAAGRPGSMGRPLPASARGPKRASS